MKENNDKVSVFNLAMNAKNRLSILKDKDVGNSVCNIFAEGSIEDSIEDLGKSIRASINQFDEDYFY